MNKKIKAILQMLTFAFVIINLALIFVLLLGEFRRTEKLNTLEQEFAFISEQLEEQKVQEEIPSGSEEDLSGDEIPGTAQPMGSADSSLDGTAEESTFVDTTEPVIQMTGLDAYHRDVHQQMDVLSLEYPRLVYSGEIKAPQKLTDDQIKSILNKRAEESVETQQILEQWKYDKYPMKLLSMMANNPEVTDALTCFVNPEYVVKTELTDAEKAMECPLFLQWDPRWAFSSYGSNYISIAGCGPTCVAMAVYALTRQDYITPNFIGDIAMKYGYYLKGSGTLWKLIDEAPELYGVYSDLFKASESVFKSELDRGNILILSMDIGDFTAIGHFIVVYGYDETGFFVNDPNCVYRSTQTWDYATLKRQMKGCFTLGLEPAPEELLQ